MKKKTVKWFKPTTTTNWHKSDSIIVRRKNALKAHSGDILATARGLAALANITKDNQTRIKAKADANHFFALHKKQKK
jgi:hypothetical protein